MHVVDSFTPLLLATDAQLWINVVHWPLVKKSNKPYFLPCNRGYGQRQTERKTG